MITSIKRLGRTLASMSILSLGALPSLAQPGLAPPQSGTTTIEKSFETIQYRDDRRYRGGNYRRGNGRNIALGIGAAIIGGIVLSEAARAEHRQSHGSDWNRCARTFRSFDSDSGTYVGYDGVRRTCPFLR